jgi:argininosuccinate lyase
MHECLRMAGFMLEHIKVNEHILDDPKYQYLFTVEEVNARVLVGVPFRDAYKHVGIEVNEGRFKYSRGNAASLKASDLGHTHAGSIGNLCNDRIAARMDRELDW